MSEEVKGFKAIFKNQKYTPQSIAVICDSKTRMNNFIRFILRDNPTSPKFVRISEFSLLNGKRPIEAHFLYGSDNIKSLNEINTYLCNIGCKIYEGYYS